jgi:hypothetical protein
MDATLILIDSDGVMDNILFGSTISSECASSGPRKDRQT